MASSTAGTSSNVSPLRRNVTANFASQLYSTAIGIAMVPVYLRYLGTEAYGLIGLFAMLQVWIPLLDLGITPTIAREAARARACATAPLSLRRLLRSFEFIFACVSASILLSMIAGADRIVTGWIRVEQLDRAEVQRALILMTGIACLRWVAGLYRGLINGFEKQVWQSGVNVGVATAHSVLVIPYLAYIGATPTHFFVYQLVISIAEFALVSSKAYRLLPGSKRDGPVWWQFGSLRGVSRFSASVAVTSTLWIVVTQTDKLVLSKTLSLSDFGMFSLATLVAGGVNILGTPLSAALLPRLTDLAARQEARQFETTYRNATQFAAVFGFTAAVFLSVFAQKILWVWTGDAAIASKAGVTLALYALGNGMLVFGAFPYYLQFARGKLTLHVVGTILFAALLVPFVLVLTLRYGSVGAGCAWLGVNAAFFLAWVPYVHRQFFGKFHLSWLLKDIGLVALPTGLAALAVKHAIPLPDARLAAAGTLVVVGLLLLTVAALSSSFARQMMRILAVRLFGVWPAA